MKLEDAGLVGLRLLNNHDRYDDRRSVPQSVKRVVVVEGERKGHIAQSISVYLPSSLFLPN